MPSTDPAAATVAGQVRRLARAWCVALGRLVWRMWPRPRRVASAESDPADLPDVADAQARLGAALTVGLAAALVAPALALPVGAVVWTVPAWRRRSAERRDQRDVLRALPDVVELVGLAARAGFTVHQTVQDLGPRLPGAAGEAMVEVHRRQGRGVRLGDALEALVERSDHLRPLAGALSAAERYGTPLGPALDRVSADARDQRRRQAEESARRLPVLLLFPLVLCILPAAGLLTVVPLVLAAWPQLH